MLVAYLLCMLIFSCLLPPSLYSHSHPSHPGQALLKAGVLQSTRWCTFLLLFNNPKSLTRGKKTQTLFLLYFFIGFWYSSTKAVRTPNFQTSGFPPATRKFYKTLSSKSELPFITWPHQTLISTPMALFQVHCVGVCFSKNSFPAWKQKLPNRDKPEYSKWVSLTYVAPEPEHKGVPDGGRWAFIYQSKHLRWPPCQGPKKTLF